jgi:Cu-processing system ATP-binding protein
MICYRAFSKRFGTQRAVESLTLDVARGEVVALLGPNGSGKTMPQKVSFPDALTGSEVVEFYRELRGAPAERSQGVLRFASLNGAGERAVGTYSGGMVQRLGLAVAMIPEAPFLLLDEPTAALDPDGLCAFYGLVEHAREDGRAVLFTSHQLGDAERLADRFAVLVGGRLVASLTAAELKDRLSERGVMRLRLASRAEGLLETVGRLAPAALWAGDELIVPGPASLRPRVLDAVRALGVEVRGLTADEGRLDVLYRELVGEADKASRGEAAR